MGWSTREVAELAGTTLRAVRHYHDLGLLPVPERAVNGYKSYQTAHLVRLLEIRRLSSIGIPLAQIATMSPSTDDFDETLAEVEAELDSRIEKLEKAREEIQTLRREPMETLLPHELAIAAKEAEVSDSDRSLYAVVSQVGGERASTHWSTMLRDSVQIPESKDFDALPEDADEATRQRLAETMTPGLVELLASNPLPPDAMLHDRGQQARYSQAVIDAMLELYNPAQLDVIARIWRAAGIV